MKLIARCLDLDAGGKTIVIMNKNDADEIGVHPLDRVFLTYNKKTLTAVVNISERFVKEGEILLYNEIQRELKIKDNDIVEIMRRSELLSKNFIRKKISGKRIDEQGIREIVKDVIQHNLNDLEISAFITALHIHGLSIDESVALTKAMAKSGETLNLKRKIICDKHSLGGVPGDKTTLLLVPILAACGLTIPKTSSRAITSPAGSADRMEALAPVDLDIKEMKRVVEKTNGCIVWGGSVNIAPADDLFIRIEYPLNLDPLYIPSIMSKKKAVGATHLVIDLPTGRGAKVKTFGEAYDLASDFISISKRMGIKTACGITFGEQPIGYNIGPALEAREILETITMKNAISHDLIDKACSLAGILLGMVNKGNKQTGIHILRTGKAEKKLREIIFEQGGNPKIKPEDIEIGEKKTTIRSEKNGTVMWIKNAEISEVAKVAGAPKDKGAGVRLLAKIGDKVKKEQPLFVIYAEKSTKLREAEKIAISIQPVVVMESLSKGMLIKRIEEEKYERGFVLER